ncbi:MAG: hypothetical protein ACRCWJ_23205, partial [Casimicrobium sp.]
AVAFISQNAGVQFDPNMTPVFIRVVERLWLLHGQQFDDALCVDIPAPNERFATDSMLDRLNDLVPKSVFEKLGVGLID